MRKLFLFVSVSLLGIAAPVYAQAPEIAVKAEDAIAQAIAAYGNAWNVGDSKGLSELYSVDADYTGFGSVMTRGREEIETRYAQLLNTTFRGSQMTLAISSLRFLRSDVAIVDGPLDLVARPTAGRTTPAGKGIFLAVMNQENGAWRITSMWSKRLDAADEAAH